ncbi:MAG TPA: hypothetical protein VJ846_10130 [Sphingomicrobium sp.]|nr:hypothetical protein [Sphingomicrobium sp.]
MPAGKVVSRLRLAIACGLLVGSGDVMKSQVLDLEPLATYLEPRFGSVYEPDYDWTSELNTAVTEYLEGYSGHSYGHLSSQVSDGL